MNLFNQLHSPILHYITPLVIKTYYAVGDRQTDTHACKDTDVHGQKQFQETRQTPETQIKIII